MRFSPLVVAAAVLLASLAAPLDVAAKGPNAKALRFDKMGKKAYGQKDWDEAIAAFEAAYQADPVPRFLYNTARAYEKKDDHRKAIEYLERYLLKVTDPKEREDASDRLSILQIKLRKTRSPVKIEAPPGALVAVKGEEGVDQAKGTLSTWLPFGAYEVTVTLKGYTTDQRTIVVKADDSVKVAVTLEKVPSKKAPAPVVAAAPAKKKAPGSDAPPPAKAKAAKAAKAAETPKVAEAPADPEVAHEAASDGPPQWVAYTVLGTGALALVGGGVAGVFSNQAYDNIQALKGRPSVDRGELQVQIDSWQDNENAANLLFVLGGVAIVSGAVLWFLAPAEASTSGSAALVPYALPGGAGVGWSADF